MKVIHILYQSLPQVSGSSIRSRDIMMSQQEIGIEVIAVTSSFQRNENSTEEDIINGIRYIRTSKKNTDTISDQRKSITKRILRLFSIFKFTKQLYKIVKKEKPNVLHAHAMFFCGLPTILIGKITKTPVVYEFRSLWMYEKNIDKKKSLLNKIIEEILLKIEIYTLKKADHAILLNDNLKNYLLDKTNFPFKNTVINNAVNTKLIDSIKAKLPLKRTEMIFGYIGTITAYEGLEFLVATFQELYDEGIKNKLIIYGKGVDVEKVKCQINKRPNIKTISFKGDIAPDEVYKAFEQLDVIINPRLDTPLTNSVTPLKPLEAMAYGKLFLGSNVGGIKELVKKENSFLFKAENKEDLKKVLKTILLLSKKEKEEYIKNASVYVQKYKSWSKNAEKYVNIYTSLIAKI